MTTYLEKLKKFLNDNPTIDFSPGNRNHSGIVVIGYLLYLGADIDEIFNTFIEYLESKYEFDLNDLHDVYSGRRFIIYCCENDYGSFWYTEKAKLHYKYEELLSEE